MSQKDFRLFAGEQAVDAFDVVELRPDSQQAVSVALLLDESPSTRSVKHEVRRAVLSLVENSPPQMQFRVMAFASDVHSQSGWTRDPAGILGAVQTGKGGKATALRRSILTAAGQLRSRPNHRILVIFTDGEDNTGQGPSDQKLVDFCQAAAIEVFCVGLENDGLDEHLLKQLAETTGGMYLKSRHAEELNGLFRHLQREFAQRVYQLRIHPLKLGKGPLTLRIGRGDSALEIPLTNTLPNGAQRFRLNPLQKIHRGISMQTTNSKNVLSTTETIVSGVYKL